MFDLLQKCYLWVADLPDIVKLLLIFGVPDVIDVTSNTTAHLTAAIDPEGMGTHLGESIPLPGLIAVISDMKDTRVCVKAVDDKLATMGVRVEAIEKTYIQLHEFNKALFAAENALACATAANRLTTKAELDGMKAGYDAKHAAMQAENDVMKAGYDAKHAAMQTENDVMKAGYDAMQAENEATKAATAANKIETRAYKAHVNKTDAIMSANGKSAMNALGVVNNQLNTMQVQIDYGNQHNYHRSQQVDVRLYELENTGSSKRDNKSTNANSASKAEVKAIKCSLEKNRSDAVYYHKKANEEIDAIKTDRDAMKAGYDAKYDAMQAENDATKAGYDAKHDAMQAENDATKTENEATNAAMNAATAANQIETRAMLDAMQAENNALKVTVSLLVKAGEKRKRSPRDTAVGVEKAAKPPRNISGVEGHYTWKYMYLGKMYSSGTAVSFDTVSRARDSLFRHRNATMNP